MAAVWAGRRRCASPAWGYQMAETFHVVTIVMFARFVAFMMNLRLVRWPSRTRRFVPLQSRLFPAQMRMALTPWPACCCW